MLTKVELSVEVDGAWGHCGVGSHQEIAGSEVEALAFVRSSDDSSSSHEGDEGFGERKHPCKYKIIWYASSKEVCWMGVLLVNCP